MNGYLLVGVFVFGLIFALPAKTDWIIGNDGSVTRSEVLGDDSEKKEEKQENKQDDKKEEKKEEKKEVKKEEGKSKIEMQKGPLQLKIDRENGVLKVKGKNEKGEEFEMETKQEDRVRIKDRDIDVASGKGQGLKVTKGEVEAETELPVTVDTKTQKMSVEGREIKVMPDEAVKNSGISNTKVELKNRGQEVVYEIKGEEKKKLFGVFDFTFNKTSVVSADTGKILENTQAWWSGLLENFAR